MMRNAQGGCYAGTSVVLIWLLLGGLLGCKKEPAREIVRPVRAMKVQDVAGFQAVSLPGRAQATEEVNLAFRVSGPLIERPVNVGDFVNQGDLIARIDPRDFETELADITSSLARARAELQAMRVARPEDINRLQAGVAAAKAEQVKAEADYTRTQQLYLNDNASKADLDQARAMRDVTREGVKSATESLRIGRRGARAEDIAAQQANIRGLEAKRKRVNDALEDTSLQAPFAGYIAETFVENFQNVRAKQAIVRLLDVARIEVVIHVPENLISLAPYMTDISCRFDAFADRQVPAETKEVGTEASQTTRTYPVTLIMNQPQDIKVLPGMAGTCQGRPDIPSEVAKQGVEIPLSAVLADTDDIHYVWVIDEAAKTVAKREVTLGNLTERGLLIEQGLQPGEWIATAGVHALREGQKVLLMNEQS